jgi:hypothetical protein
LSQNNNQVTCARGPVAVEQSGLSLRCEDRYGFDRRFPLWRSWLDPRAASEVTGGVQHPDVHVSPSLQSSTVSQQGCSASQQDPREK